MDEDADTLTGLQPRRLASVSAAFFALVLIAVVLLLFRANDAREAANAAERHTYDVLVAAESFESAVGRAEAALGVFVVSGDPKDGTRYYDEWLKAGRLLDRVQQLTNDNPNQRALINRLRALYSQRSAELARPANLATYKRQWASFSALAENGATPTATEMRRTLDKIGEEERTRLAHRRDHARSVTDWSNLLDTTLIALGVMLIAGAGLLGWTAVRAIAARRDTERRVTEHKRRTEELERAVATRTAELSAANIALRSEAEERAAAEAALRQMQKMEAVGQLSGGIAHDFNNMLAVVIGGLDMAQRRLHRETEEIEKHITNAMEGANRAAALTRRLLAFARQQPLESEGVAVDTLLQGMSELLSRTLGEMIETEILVDPGLWQVWTDPSQLENAILNLAVNGRDAMPGGGKLSIIARNRTITHNVTGGRGEVQPGEYVVIKVLDTGCGMPEQVRDRALEPFFTTKDVGKGTGLGLSQIYGFVRQSGGDITIESTLDVGTTVTLYLRRHISDGAAQPTVLPISAAPRQALTPPPAPVPGKILVVEDEPRVRASTTAALNELGFEVIEAESGTEGLAILREDTSIVLLLTDVVMPEMSGPELAVRASVLRPDLRVMFTTGYSGNVEDAGGTGVELLGSTPVLHKPFTIAALDTKIREILSHRVAA